MSEIEIKYEGQKKNFKKYTSYYEISKGFGIDNIIGIIVNNKVTSLYDKAEKSANINFIDINSDTGSRIYTAGIKMIFEYAVKKLFERVNVKFSYSIPTGLIAEIDTKKKLTDEDTNLIKKQMDTIVAKDIAIEKLIVTSNDGINYYDNLGNNIKSSNIKNITDSTVMLYRLDNLVNYYYSEMPYSTSIINKYELKNIGNNMIVINYPGDHDNGKVPEFVDYSGIVDAYKQGKKWLTTMHVPYVKDVNKAIYGGKIESFVRSAELNFNLEINETAKYVAQNKNIKYVMISGPSSSGKTTVTKRLASYFEIYGLNPIVVSLDDYFRERIDTPKDANGNYEFECLEALDLKYLASDIQKLLNGEEINLPRFNFITGCKEISSRKIKLTDNTILLFEGLHAVSDKLLPMISKKDKYNIYVSPYMPICIDEHNYITSDDLRLLRRIVRDFRTRGFEIERTIKSNQKVHEGEIKYLNPYIPTVNKIINTSLPYEIGVLKVFVEPLLFSVPAESIYYNDARRLLSFLKQFFTISSEFVPRDSILREFIGGDNND